jgi:hypothetical protein
MTYAFISLLASCGRIRGLFERNCPDRRVDIHQDAEGKSAFVINSLHGRFQHEPHQVDVLRIAMSIPHRRFEKIITTARNVLSDTLAS